MKALEKDPAARFQTCEEFSAAIAAALSAPAVEPKPQRKEVKPEPAKLPPRTRSPWAPIAVLIALAAGGIYLYTQSGAKDPNPPHFVAAKTLTGHTSTVMSVAFSPNGQLLASGSADRTLKFWTASGAELFTAQGGYTNAVNQVAFSPDGKILASGNQNWTIKLWSPENGSEVASWEAGRGSVESIAFSPNGQTLAIRRSMDANAELWYVPTHQLLATLTGPKSWLTSVAFSPDGSVLAGGGLDGVMLWALTRDPSGLTGRELRHLDAGYVNAVAISPDGTTLAAARRGLEIQLWSLADGARGKSLAGHTDSVGAVAFSPDGKYLASGGGDATVRVWSASSGALLQTLTGHTGGVDTVAWTPDGRTLASGGLDSTIRIWRREQ
jgi:WD40 repeat protein